MAKQKKKKRRAPARKSIQVISTGAPADNAGSGFQISQSAATILVAIIGLVGVAIGHFATSLTSLDVALTNAEATAKLEQQKFVQATIAAIIGKGAEQEQIKQLRFYATIGVIGDPYAAKILALKDSELPVSVPTTVTAREIFFRRYRTAFGSFNDEAEAALTKIFKFIEQDKQMTDVRQVAYILATIQSETNGTFKPTTESDADLRMRLGMKTGGGVASPEDLTNLDEGRYRGRGYVQMTWKANYQRAGQALGLDLVGQPDLALEPEVAYRILALGMKEGIFTLKKLSEYVAGEKVDYVNARRVVNGLDGAAETIAKSARSFETILRESLSAAR